MNICSTMGLEWRNSNPYYYRKWRVGDRVVSAYQGSGLAVFLAERHTAEAAEEKAERRRAFEQQRACIEAISAEVDRVVDRIEALVEAEMILAGYHKHKRQWRKRRDG